MSDYRFISDAAKEVHVESHVLRYWEEELNIPIGRNEQGHRFYTTENVEMFKQIKAMKERGLQLKAIKMILKNGKVDLLEEKPAMAIEIVEPVGAEQKGHVDQSREEKAKKLMLVLRQMMDDALEENNKAICNELRESIVKELDYQFRAQEEREEERETASIQRNEKYYEKLDHLLRNGTKEKEGKKKRHFLF